MLTLVFFQLRKAIEDANTGNFQPSQQSAKKEGNETLTPNTNEEARAEDTLVEDKNKALKK